MKKMKEKVGKSIGKMAVFAAKMEANSACPYLTYQPEKPDAVKKLRKF